jgi:BirA family biotin operon repressor/biotin-[acetyl-CoA-carboxylase] ligase
VGVANAVSLTDLGVASPDRQRLIGRLLGELGSRVEAWRRAGGADQRLLSDYRTRSSTLGQRVRAILPGDREIVGVARDVDDEGRLVIDDGASTVTVSAADIVHLRPGDGG